MVPENLPVLIFRLSSLGDVVLAMSVLSSHQIKRCHWVVSKPYQALLKGHPKIEKLWVYDKKTGLKGWVQLLEQISKEPFSLCLDLQESLRTRFAKMWWQWKGKRPLWIQVKKDRFRFYGFCLFKKYWPSKLLPRHRKELFLKTLKNHYLESTSGFDSDSDLFPDLSHLLCLKNKNQDPLKTQHKDTWENWSKTCLKNQGKVYKEKPSLGPFSSVPFSKPFLLVMPASKWKSKQWPLSFFEKLLLLWPQPVVVLGGQEDFVSEKLCLQLLKKGKTVFFAKQWSFKELAWLFKKSFALLSNDTGMAHFAQAFKVPTAVLLGPTHSKSGFGPWEKHAFSVETDLSCRPCGKDGRFCFRIRRKQLCLKNLSSEQVYETLYQNWLSKNHS